MRAKYTHRTKLRFVLCVFRSARLSRHKADVFARRVPMHSLTGKVYYSHLIYLICPLFQNQNWERRKSLCQEIHLCRCKSSIMFVEESIISPVTKNRKISMRYMKPQTENFGQNLPSAIRQNLRKAVQRENVSKQENLSLPCRNPLWIIRQTDY